MILRFFASTFPLVQDMMRARRHKLYARSLDSRVRTNELNERTRGVKSRLDVALRLAPAVAAAPPAPRAGARAHGRLHGGTAGLWQDARDRWPVRPLKVNDAVARP